MLHLVYSPHWFCGKDIFIDLFSILVLSLIGLFSIKFYKIDKRNKNYLRFGLAFFILAVSFLFKILTNFTLYYYGTKIEKIGFIQITYHVLKTSDILFSIGSFMYFFLGLLGLFTLHEIYNKAHNKENIFLVIYLLLLLSFFSFSKYFVFHFTSLVLLIFISGNYFRNYRKKKNIASKFLGISFFILAISQFLFIFMEAYDFFYVLAESIQLIGYFILLFVLVKIIKYGKKK